MPDHVNIVAWQVSEAVIENGITKKKKHILIRVSTEMQDSIVIELMLTSLLNFSELLADVIEFQVNTSNYLIVSGCYMSEIYFTSRQATVTSVTTTEIWVKWVSSLWKFRIDYRGPLVLNQETGVILEETHIESFGRKGQSTIFLCLCISST